MEGQGEGKRQIVRHEGNAEGENRVQKISAFRHELTESSKKHGQSLPGQHALILPDKIDSFLGYGLLQQG